MTKIYGTPFTEVFVSENGGICIKQYEPYEGDQFVYFSVAEAETIISAIKKCVQEAKGVKDGE